jgi:hypothetical protein
MHVEPDEAYSRRLAVITTPEPVKMSACVVCACDTCSAAIPDTVFV